MKIILKPIAYTLSCVTCLFILFSFNTGTNIALSTANQAADTLDTLALLRSKKWVEYLNMDTISAIFTFDGDIATLLDYDDGEYIDPSIEPNVSKGHFYLSNTRDETFNSSKLGTRSGKYLILETTPTKYRKETAIAFKISINRDTLKLKVSIPHPIAGPGGPVIYVARPKTN